jgi:hypothetical protein
MRAASVKVVGNQLWLDRRGKLRLEHIGDAGVMQLSAAFQQRLIRGILNERVVEQIVCVRRQPLSE